MKKTVSYFLVLGALFCGIATFAYFGSRPPIVSNGNDMNASPTLIRLGDARGSEFSGNDSSIDNHPSGAKFYQREWARGSLGEVEFAHGKHGFIVANVLSVLGFADKDVPEGIYEWNINFGVSAEQADTHEAALARVTTFLTQLRAAGWKRYIDVGDPRLRGRTAWLYGASFPVATYSLDSEYVPTQQEWNEMLRHSPRWIFVADDAHLEVSVMESNMGGFAGKSTYMLTANVKSEYAFYGLGYFPGNAEKIHNWKALLPAELNKYHVTRVKTETALKEQGYEIDTTYQDPPIMALQASHANQR